MYFPIGSSMIFIIPKSVIIGFRLKLIMNRDSLYVLDLIPPNIIMSLLQSRPGADTIGEKVQINRRQEERPL